MSPLILQNFRCPLTSLSHSPIETRATFDGWSVLVLQGPPTSLENSQRAISSWKIGPVFLRNLPNSTDVNCRIIYCECFPILRACSILFSGSLSSRSLDRICRADNTAWNSANAAVSDVSWEISLITFPSAEIPRREIKQIQVYPGSNYLEYYTFGSLTWRNLGNSGQNLLDLK